MSTFFITTVLFLWKAHLSETAWNTDYAHAIRYVRSLDKPLVILFDIPSSASGPWDQSAAFAHEKVGKVIAEDYVRLFVDLQTEPGRQLAAEFGVAEYPRLVVLDRSGEWQVYRKSGFHTVDELEMILNRYRRTKLVSSGAGESRPSSTVSSPAGTMPGSTCKT